ncbi:MAG: hypothetical protein K8F91_21740 [Candidatus Obscuribacterales bacterium]|nr:hypothetical protein [Candidatus Obscuribacterales bacterium]
MKALETNEFLALKGEIESNKRLHGYYIIKIAEITALRECSDSETIAEQVFRYFDDQEWPPVEQRPQDQTWSDYAVDRPIAREHTICALVGGNEVGHTKDTIARKKAEEFVDRFESLFDQPRIYYIGMGFGDRKYVFQSGMSIISNDLAGILWVVESD